MFVFHVRSTTSRLRKFENHDFIITDFSFLENDIVFIVFKKTCHFENDIQNIWLYSDTNWLHCPRIPLSWPRPPSWRSNDRISLNHSRRDSRLQKFRGTLIYSRSFALGTLIWTVGLKRSLNSRIESRTMFRASTIWFPAFNPRRIHHAACIEF